MDTPETSTVARHEFQTLLQNMPEITYETSWHRAQQLLAKNSVFTNSQELYNMDKLEALELFMQHIKALQGAYREVIQEHAAKEAKQDRKFRKAFSELLDELYESNIITGRSKWKDVIQHFSSHKRYQNMFKQTGPTPLDYFKIRQHQWIHDFNNDVQLVKEIMQNQKFKLTFASTFSDFISGIHLDPNFHKVKAANLTDIYNKLFGDKINRAADHAASRKQIEACFERELDNCEKRKKRDTGAVRRHFQEKWGLNKTSEKILIDVFNWHVKNSHKSGST